MAGIAVCIVIFAGIGSYLIFSGHADPLPANDDAALATTAATCAYPVSATQPAGTTTISDTPTTFDTTNGDILAATTFVSGSTHLLVMGGNFSDVITPDGVKHPAQNLAVVSEETGAVAYAGTGVTSYVRAVAYSNGVIYAGGDFTTFGGKSRDHLAAITAPNGGLTSWAPSYGGTIYAIAANASNVYVGGSSNLEDLKPSTGAGTWSDSVVGGPVRALLLSPGQTGLYVAGLFSQISTEVRSGLLDVYASNGVPYTPFAPILRPNTHKGAKGTYDGEVGLSLAWDTSYSPARLVLGYGGAIDNGVASINPATGVGYWNHHTEGDSQGVGVVGNVYVVGYHRNHGNESGCPYPYFSTAFTQTNGTILSYWNPNLSGIQSDADGGNNGVQAITVDTGTGKLFLLGAFTKYDASCDIATITCTGGANLQSIARLHVLVRASSNSIT